MRSSRGVSALRYVVLSLLALLFLLPFYVLLRNGFSSERLLASAQWRWLPDEVNLGNLRELFTNDSIRMARSMANSAVVAVVQTVATVVISALAGYGLARIDHRLSRLVLGLTVLTLMVPAAVTFIPSFVLVSSLGWISTLRGLIIPVLFSAFATFLFRQFFLGFPHELEEAAYIDGAGYWRTFWRVVMPNTYGICAAVGTITFIGSWNAFLWPLLIGQDRDFRTVQVALSQFMSSQRVDVPQLFVGAAVAILPVLLVFLFLQRYLVQGVERSGID
ncbi:MAG: ABC transporter, permease protein 2 (cluster 1, maltose/g3p/polyamine/iron) [uncultured Friedmanniella sp.]|uniref:ABC transporter, permease protein 2 (Cluster 1, maltose/g3p/polyamine/iron) n=1 Tax=uncultured Friedmanniella sp. TaxID=335381 RepID=A0A6J4K3R8_9ACTN|nr:MAG: ABC transporter, permease protein 2 (cluster 1, maltose/g3p/polyamine/iron) [uncultured Friedmanniella sp.]